MNKEDKKIINELNDLRRQMQYENKYDNDIQAAPRFWVVGDYKWISTMEGNAERYSVYIPEYGDSYEVNDFLEEERKEIEADESILGSELTEVALDDLDYVTCEFSALGWIKEFIDEGAYLIPEEQVHFIHENTLFLTKKDAKEHINKNKHHYSNRVHTYAMTAWRSESFKIIWDVLMDSEILIGKFENNK